MKSLYLYLMFIEYSHLTIECISPKPDKHTYIHTYIHTYKHTYIHTCANIIQRYGMIVLTYNIVSMVIILIIHHDQDYQNYKNKIYLLPFIHQSSSITFFHYQYARVFQIFRDLQESQNGVGLHYQ